jgi:hypothetical protein
MPGSRICPIGFRLYVEAAEMAQREGAGSGGVVIRQEPNPLQGEKRRSQMRFLGGRRYMVKVCVSNWNLF